ncbi:fungal-specific transcription factor domain-containing protein [Tirmania nivea]|nr:fungal-specific transcription factor domain-containing protein [Tirmania nivea]
MMHAGNNMADTISSTYSYSSPIHDSVPVLPSQQQPPARMQNDSTLNGSMGQYRRRRQGSGGTGDRGRSSFSTSSASSVAQHPIYSSSVNGASSRLPNRGVRVVAPVSIASSSMAATTVKTKRKRSMIACRNCNERRVRCDGSVTGLPCTTCKSAGRTDCAFIDSKRVRGKRGRFESRDKVRSQSETQSLITPGEEEPNRPQSMAFTQSPRLPPVSISQSLPCAIVPPGASQSGFHSDMPCNSHMRSPMDNHIQLGDTRRQSSITENDIWRRLFESQPGVPQTQRITYVGEAWHLSWVLHQKTGSTPLHFASPVVDGSPETPPARRIGSAGVPLDKPNLENSRTGQMVSEIARSNPQAASAVQASLDAFVFPPAPIQDALIKAYFSHFHPFFPILNKERFESHLNSSMTNKSPSLLLLQSMLVIGAIHCPLSILTSPLTSHKSWKPFSNRSTAIETLVHRARMLFSIDYEMDRLSIIQSMFLLQFWWRIPGEYKDQSYWVAGALRIAQSMGLHRSTRESWAKGILEEQEQMLWRKMWWALYIRDRQIAAAMGKPVLIQDEDCDVEELSMQDFPTEPKETALFMIETVRLIRVLHEILKCEFTPVTKTAYGGAILPSDRASRRERCQRMLEDWQRALPPELRGDLMVTTDLFSVLRTLTSSSNI